MNVFELIEQYRQELMIVSSTLPEITEGKFLKIAKSTYTMQDGTTFVREELVKRNNNAAIILPVTKEGKIVLVMQPRPLTKEGVTIEVPAGYIDDNEKEMHAAGRELEEETGYVPKIMIPLGEIYQDQGCSRATNSLFVALGCERIREQKLDKDEFVRYFECTYEELQMLVSMGYIKSANVLLAIKLGGVFAHSYINNIGKVKKTGS